MFNPFSTAYRALTAEDRDWARHINTDNIRSHFIDAAIDEAPARIAYMNATFDIAPPVTVAAIDEAMLQRKTGALEILLADVKNKSFLEELFSDADTPEVWNALCRINAAKIPGNPVFLPERDFLTEPEIARIAVESGYDHALDWIKTAKHTPGTRSATLEAAIDTAALNALVSPATLHRLIGYQEQFGPHPHALGKALETAGRCGDVLKASGLMHHGADPAWSKAKPLMAATYETRSEDGPHATIVRLMVHKMAENGTDLRALKPYGPHLLIEKLADMIDEKREELRPSLSVEHTLVTARLPDGGTLQVNFNFKSGRATMTEPGKPGIHTVPISEDVLQTREDLSRATHALKFGAKS